jgi:hypothetical protein
MPQKLYTRFSEKTSIFGHFFEKILGNERFGRIWGFLRFLSIFVPQYLKKL